MDRMKAILTLSAAMLFVTSPFYAGAFGGYEPDQFPIPQENPPIVPAGYAFSIWGLIYVLLLVHGVFGLLKRDEDPEWDRTRWPLIISLGVGASWISIAQVSPVWATMIICLMLITALIALFRVAVDKDRLFLATPIALYAGWLTAASCVSIALVGAGYGILADETGWAWLSLVLALGIAVIVQMKLPQAPEYGLAIAWALIAIFMRNLNSEITLAFCALGAAFLIGAIALRGFIFRSTPTDQE